MPSTGRTVWQRAVKGKKFVPQVRAALHVELTRDPFYPYGNGETHKRFALALI